jgi:hypothetical protein
MLLHCTLRTLPLPVSIFAFFFGGFGAGAGTDAIKDGTAVKRIPA